MLLSKIHTGRECNVSPENRISELPLLGILDVIHTHTDSKAIIECISLITVHFILPYLTRSAYF
jgi:hypothetical protein